MIKQTSDGKKGGTLVGDAHSDSSGGIEAVITDTERPVLLEDGEAIINKHAVKKHWRMLSKINQSAGGGVPIGPPAEALNKYQYNDGGNITSQENKTTLLIKTDKHEIENVLSGKSAVKYGKPIQAIASYLRASQKTSTKFRGASLYKKEEEQKLKQLAIDNNLWMSNDFGEPFGQGAEQQVYLKDERSVLKTTYAPFYNTWEDYFNNLLLHNYFFPDTAYKLIGFTSQGTFKCVVEQAFVQATSPTNQEEVQQFMSDNGFKHISEANYENKELGIILEDLHSANVLTKNGVLTFIDTVFYISPDSGFKFETGGNIEGRSDFSQEEKEKVHVLIEKAFENFEQIKAELISQEQTELQKLNETKQALIDEKKDIYDKQKDLPYGPERTALYNRDSDIYKEKISVDNAIITQSNRLQALSNGGTLISFKDKKDQEHKSVSDFTPIGAKIINFSEETILTETSPDYIPFINEEIFRMKGYVFDSIRVAPNKYLVAANGHKENEQTGEHVITVGSVNKDFENDQYIDVDQGYILVTLDQLALINQYYFTKAKAIEQQKADERTKSSEAYYDKLPVERRQRHLFQKGFYNSLPVVVKKKITEVDYQALTLEEREKLYKPFKRYGTKRLSARLREDEMWTSYHKMYERFINPSAVHPSRGIAHPEVFAYWRIFRDMMAWKIIDLKYQREDESEVRKIALETSFGSSNTNDSLKEEFGILVKRQDGSQIGPAEIDQIRSSWVRLEKTYGGLSTQAARLGLKISHTGNKYVFASHAAGVYVPKMMTIAVSAKFGAEQFDQIMAHEAAHWIDNTIGAALGGRYLTDDYESTAGKIASLFRKNMNEKSDREYINATKECFARAMEQYFAIENYGDQAQVIYSSGMDFKSFEPYFAQPFYINKEKYETLIRPLIVQFMQEHQEFFSKAEPAKEQMEPQNIETKPDINMSAEEVMQERTQRRDRLISEIEIFNASKKQRTDKDKLLLELSGYFAAVVSNDPQSLREFLDMQTKITPKSVAPMAQWVLSHDGQDAQEFREKLNTNIWNLIPEPLKEYTLPKRVLYRPFPDNAELIKIVTSFTTHSDYPKLSMAGVLFDENGIIATDANRLIFLSHPGKREPQLYCMDKDCLKAEEKTGQDIESATFPDYKKIIPNMTQFMSIHTESLIAYLSAVKNAKYHSDVLTECYVMFGNKEEGERVVLNVNLLMEAAMTMYKLGYEEIDIGYSGKFRPVVFCKKGNIGSLQKLSVDFIMTMPVNFDFPDKVMYFDVENECVSTLDIEGASCLNPVKIKADRDHAHKEQATQVLEEIKKEKTELDQHRSANKIAMQLQRIDSKIFDELLIKSGGDLYDNDKFQKDYKIALDEKIIGKFAFPLPDKVFDILEDDNYHALNQYLTYTGAFGEEKKQKLISYADDNTRKTFMLNPAPYLPKVEPTKPTKEILQTRLKLVKKMSAKKSSAVLRARIRIIEKMLKNPEKFCCGGNITMIEKKEEGGILLPNPDELKASEDKFRSEVAMQEAFEKYIDKDFREKFNTAYSRQYESMYSSDRKKFVDQKREAFLIGDLKGKSLKEFSIEFATEHLKIKKVHISGELMGEKLYTIETQDSQFFDVDIEGLKDLVIGNAVSFGHIKIQLEDKKETGGNIDSPGNQRLIQYWSGEQSALEAKKGTMDETKYGQEQGKIHRILNRLHGRDVNEGI